MSCGMPCWNCQEPVPEERHGLNAMQRVFCSDKCTETFRDQVSKEVEEL